LAFGALSYSAVRTKSATFDEPLHVVGGFMHRFYGDYRINPEDPALLGLWAALPMDRDTIRVDAPPPARGSIFSEPFESTLVVVDRQWLFVTGALFQTPANDGAAIVNASRRMFVLTGMLLIGVVSWWGWRLGGAVGALVPAALLTLDPNFLAHAAMVKSDVPMALLMVSMAYGTWRLGQPSGRGSWWRLVVLALVVGVAFDTKFSGVLLGPMLALLLVARATLPREQGGGPWRLAGVQLASMRQRLLASALVCLAVGLVAWGTTWAAYGFRFAPTPEGRMFDSRPFYESIVPFTETMAEHIEGGRLARPTREEVLRHRLGTTPRLIAWAEDHRLLPQAWLFGFLYTYSYSLVRNSYLLGELRPTGWWYYFPAAMLFKTPLATLLALAGAATVGLGRLATLGVWRRRPTRDEPSSSSGVDLWAGACLVVPPLVYGLVAVLANLNIGLRHVLPVYPFLYLGVGVVAARLARVVSRAAIVSVGGALLVLRAVETLGAYPDYLAFFNRPSRAADGQLNTKLGDSNLDWGQDLVELAAWQRAHADRPMYIAYFGSADYGFYGVRAGNVIGRYPFRPVAPPPAPGSRAYLAVSATELQGIYSGDEFAALRQGARPLAVLGSGTIFVFDWAPSGAPRGRER
jgi:4-amino-4-deoxy-L-arabinose transferase-like glycosyltransferase